KQSNPKKTYLNFRNSLFMLYKNLPQQHRFSIIFKRLCLDGLAGIKFFFNLQPLHTFAIIKAHFAYYKNLSKLKHKQTNNPKTNYFYTENIVFDYFLKGKKFFNQL